MSVEFSKEELKEWIEDSGYEWFDDKQPYLLNIIGIRLFEEIPNEFTDQLYCIYRDYNLDWKTDKYVITTTPGVTMLKKPLKSVQHKGTAILVPGQYKDVYKIDKHLGKYDALCQRNGKVKVFRDNNRDKFADMDWSSIEEGVFGVNIHRSDLSGESKVINRWSAGCQVFRYLRKYYDFMDIVYESADRRSNRQDMLFTYTLLDEALR